MAKSKILKVPYVFKLYNRTYEGDFTYELFIQNCLIVLRNRYPFLPKELLNSRARGIWNNEVKKLKQQLKAPVFHPKSTKKAKVSVNASSVKRSVLDLSSDDTNDGGHQPEESSINLSSSSSSLFDPSDSVELPIWKSPVIDSCERGIFDSNISSSNFASQNIKFSSTKCSVSEAMVDLEFGSDVFERKLTTTIEPVYSSSSQSHSDSSESFFQSTLDEPKRPKVSVCRSPVDLMIEG